jgi:hypothetical protein
MKKKGESRIARCLKRRRSFVLKPMVLSSRHVKVINQGSVDKHFGEIYSRRIE